MRLKVSEGFSQKSYFCCRYFKSQAGILKEPDRTTISYSFHRNNPKNIFLNSKKNSNFDAF